MLTDQRLTKQSRHPFRPMAGKIRDLETAGLYRRHLTMGHDSAVPGTTQIAGRSVQVWCSNDYLGLSQHPHVIEALTRSATLHGAGMGGSRAIGGTSASHASLERRLASWHGKDRALIFSSGYVSNFETLTVLLDSIPDVVVLSDALNHRSLIEGIRKSSCERIVFGHNDPGDLSAKIANMPLDRPKLIVFESIYSMDADIGHIRAICDIAEQYGAMTFIDETHAIGVRGPTGAGLCEELGEDRATFIQGVFGKALGTLGGYVAGPEIAMDYVRLHAPGYIFTTALPQAIIDATLQSLDLVQGGTDLRARVSVNSRVAKMALRTAGIRFVDEADHIIPVLIPGAANVQRVARRLLEEHAIYVQPINFPSVPVGAERIRVTVPPYRTQAEIERFVSSLRACLD